MKTRNGFVSNSSSSSFCIYGIHLEERMDLHFFSEYKKKNPMAFLEAVDAVASKMDKQNHPEIFILLKNVGELSEEDAEELNEWIEEDPELFYSVLSDNFKILSYHSICGTDFYVGREWKKIANGETGAEFKKTTEELLKTIFGNEIECQTHEEAWWQ